MRGSENVPITPYEDKKIIIDHIITDPYILSLGFTKKMTFSTNTVAENITTDNMQIFVFNASSIDNDSNALTLGQIIEVNVITPIDKSERGDLCVEQIIALLEGYEWENHSNMTVIAPSPVPLASPSGFYCVAARFLYFTSKINKIKTI